MARRVRTAAAELAEVRPGPSAGEAATELAGLLRADDARADVRWRSWARELLRGGALEPGLLEALWDVIWEFDDELAGHLAAPAEVPPRTVVVSGSGKEGFKTFNVSTGAALMAAAAGAPVVKGVSDSVSAVSGSSNVLAELRVPVQAHPGAVMGQLADHGIAFIPYSAFCRRYASRYDGRFLELTPMSLFVPAGVLAVTAHRFVHGVAHPAVRVAAETIRRVRPGTVHGCVVSSFIEPGETVDEVTEYGTATVAFVDQLNLSVRMWNAGPAPAQWRHAVRHRRTHRENAQVLKEALTPDGDPAVAGMVDTNATVIVHTAFPEKGYEAARESVRRARRDGRATRLLQRLRES